MRKFYILFITCFLSIAARTQIVTTDPSIPTDNQPVTILFHADQGNQGLMNYTGDDVYAHTGVITDKSTSSTDWKYVKAAWTSNIAACKLTKVSANEYQLQITPDIRTFYGVPDGDKILKMAFVFRNANGSKTGRDTGGSDIFADVYEEGLQVSFIQPADLVTFATKDEAFSISVSANDADSLLLYLDNALIKKTPSSSFDTSIIASGNNTHEIIVIAKKAALTTSDTSYYLIPGTTSEEVLPSGIEDGITYAADDSVIFSLFAPGKGYIYLLGDFNNWLPDSIYQLKKDGERFWIGLGDLIPGKEYAFQYIIDGDIRIADPYTEKILDPFNDKFIPASVYPDLLPYPESKTNQIAGVIQPGKPQYTWGDDAYVAPPYDELIIYELLIRDFVSTHDIKDVAEKLDYLQKLGVNAIELMPFSEFEGNSSWGYNPSFYFATDKYYGRDTDIKAFIRECHKRGIAVIMDMVLNHAYGQNPMVRMYFNSGTGKPAPDNPWFNEDSPNPVYSWGYDFNHESEATQAFVDRVVEYWLTEYKIDGFRFDFTKGFTNTPGDGSAHDASRIEILKRIYDKIKTVNALAYMICEHFAPNSEEEILSDYGMLIWGNSNYNFSEASMGYNANSDFSWASYQSRGWTNPTLVSYMESHDEERLMFKNITYGNSNSNYNIKNTATALKRQELAGIFFFSIPGPKMIWQFGELGYDVSIEVNGRVGEKPVKWEYYNDAERQHLYLVWARMLDLRHHYPVFNTGDYTMTVGNNIALKKILLQHTEGDALVLGNFGMTTNEIQPGFTKTGWWFDLFSGDSLNVSDTEMTLALDAGEYRVYGSKKMESVISGIRKINSAELVVYPNPVGDLLYIGVQHKIDRVEIINLTGITVLIDTNIDTGFPVNVSGLDSGIYLVRIYVDGEVRVGRFVKQ